MILRYRIQSAENENFLMDVDIPHTFSLLQFNDFVLREVGYDPCMTSIFSLSPDGYRQREYTCIDMDVDFSPAPIQMSSVLMGEMVVENTACMDLVFDNLEDRSFQITFLDRIEPVSGFSYPRVSFINSVAPNQYDASTPLSSKSIFDEMMEDMNGCDGMQETSSDDEW